ncbi:hypothetical protein SAY87_006356 [Trapa incisa]|uniref:Peptidase metallopeptidase domain-containing protein n=1 Tax=Trapa incisa TaxID=236973 RepID=A0AAN7PZ21_9MYRT|nr:hypothetical protein SAY87_006356 [Trapa incisa]
MAMNHLRRQTIFTICHKKTDFRAATHYLFIENAVSTCISLHNHHSAIAILIWKLDGSHKGTKTKDIVQLKQYMEKYGYLHHHHTTDEAGGDVFDDRLEEAVKTFSTVLRPECHRSPGLLHGLVHGEASVRGRRHKNRRAREPPPRACILPPRGKPKWASNKYHLTYEYAPGTPQLFFDVIPRALGRWASLTPFTFSRASSYESADLRIGVFRGDHGDGSPFDGPSGVTAHAGAPYVGIVHFDADEKFSDGVEDDAFHLETIALHEFGHSLGLLHSSDPTAIMLAYTNHDITCDI